MTKEEFKKKMIEEDLEGLEVLTLDKAMSLIGKKIMWSFYPDRANSIVVEEVTIGAIRNAWAMAKETLEESGTMAERLKKSFSRDFLKKYYKDRIVILDENGKDTYIRCEVSSVLFDEPTFTCSDEDRRVFYTEAE